MRNINMITKIISGGQTGVDQAALDTAIEFEIPTGGWCPRGGHDENGKCFLNRYSFLQETRSPNPDERTKLNIESSDGTLILLPKIPIPDNIKDGTLLTIQHADAVRKPYILISLEDSDQIEKILRWIDGNNVSVLNIAGPRESSAPGIYSNAREFFRTLYAELKHNYGTILQSKL